MNKQKKGLTPRKKAKIKSLISQFILAGISITFIAVGISKTISSSFYWLIMVAFGPIGILVSLTNFFEDNRHINRIYCRKCGELLDYETDVEWDETDCGISSFSNANGTTTTAKSRVTFHCVCHNCGTEKNFSKKFVIGTLDKKGLKTNSLESQVKKYFRKFQFHL